MTTQIFKTTALILLTSNFLIANSCSGGVCGASTTPYIPSDIEDTTDLKPFNVFAKKEIKKGYKGWLLADNAGDTDIGKNRFMSGLDINSFLTVDDKLTLFGLVSSKNIYGKNLKSGKVSYAYPLSWKDIVLEASYIQSNYSLTKLLPGTTGIGKNRSIEGKITYPLIDSEKENLKFSLYLNNNTIDDTITNDFFITNNGKESYSIAAHIDFETKKYPIFNLDTNHKLSLALTTGKLTFSDTFNEKLDKSNLNTQGSYTKMNLDYKNTMLLSSHTTLKSNFRGQYALNNKNLDDSELFTVGGINGVKVYETSTTYDSNGIFLNIEGLYKLPEFKAIKNSIGIFYDYGQVWASDPLPSSEGTITVQDTGLGIYTTYKKFFSKIQAAYEVGNAKVSTKSDKHYRVLFQAGIVY